MAPVPPTRPLLPLTATPTMAAPPPRDKPAWQQVADTFDASLALIGNVLGRAERLLRDLRRDARGVASDAAALQAVAARHAVTVRDAVRATPRFTRILREGLQLVARYRIHRARLLHLTAEEAQPAWDAVHAAAAARVTALCLELGGGVLKLGQLLSCRADLLPIPWVEALTALQDRVPAEPWEAVAPILAEAFGVPLEEVFARVDQEPLAAASLAQVHAAALLDGREVVIKIRRPGIEDVIEVDVSALRVLGRVVGDLLPGLDLEPITEEIAPSLVAELDFAAEARHAQGFAERFAGRDGVVVPAVVEALCSARVMVMERIDAPKITAFLDACEAEGEAGAAARDALCARLVEAFADQILSHEVLHCDPHPGNLMVAPGPRLVLLDFGSVRAFEPGTGRVLASLTGAFLAGQTDKVAAALEAQGFYALDGDRATLLRWVELFLEAFREHGASLAELDPRAQLAEALALAREGCQAAQTAPPHGLCLTAVRY